MLEKAVRQMTMVRRALVKGATVRIHKFPLIAIYTVSPAIVLMYSEPLHEHDMVNICGHLAITYKSVHKSLIPKI